MAPLLDEEQCCQLHVDLLRATLSNCQQVSGVETVLWVSATHDLFKTRPYSLFNLDVQQGNDLGQKMSFACQQALRDCEAILLLGADCPLVSANLIEQAFEAVAQGHDMAIVPANDGGYAAMALRAEQPTLFEGLDWGSDQVFKQTLAAADAAGLSYWVLPSVPDIDRPEDLLELKAIPSLAFWANAYLNT